MQDVLYSLFDLEVSVPSVHLGVHVFVDVYQCAFGVVLFPILDYVLDDRRILNVLLFLCPSLYSNRASDQLWCASLNRDRLHLQCGSLDSLFNLTSKGFDVLEILGVLKSWGG